MKDSKGSSLSSAWGGEPFFPLTILSTEPVGGGEDADPPAPSALSDDAFPPLTILITGIACGGEDANPPAPITDAELGTGEMAGDFSLVHVRLTRRSRACA